MEIVYIQQSCLFELSKCTCCMFSCWPFSSLYLVLLDTIRSCN